MQESAGVQGTDSATTTAAQQYHQQQSGLSTQIPKCTLHMTFWAAAGVGWFVWMFAVIATSDDKWLKIDNIGTWDVGVWVSAADDRLLRYCDELEDGDVVLIDEESCDVYRDFSSVQIIGIIVCSLAVATLALACFRPVASGCASATFLALTGSVLMAVYAIFQLVALLVVADLKHNINDYEKSVDDDDTFVSYTTYGNYYGNYSDSELGPTFVVGVFSFCFAAITAAFLLGSVRHAGDGPLYGCCHSLMIKNNEPVRVNASDASNGENEKGTVESDG